MDDFLDLREDMKLFKKAKILKLYFLLVFMNAIILISNYNFQISQFRHTLLILIGNGVIAYKFLKIVRNENTDNKNYKVFSINGGIALFFVLYFVLIFVLPSNTYLLHYEVGIINNLLLGIINFLAMFGILCIYDNDGKLNCMLIHIFRIVINEWKCICICIMLYALWRIGMIYFIHEPMKAYLAGLSVEKIIAIGSSESIISPIITQFFIFYVIDLLVGTFLQVRMYLYFVFIYERN